MDISELYNLPTDEKLKIVAELWDNIAESDAPIALSPAVIAEVDRRRAELAADPSIAIERDEMWRRVNEFRDNRPGSNG
jgi:putative addiction module component (TIGR02574 family)